MDWTSLVMALLGGTSVLGVVGAVVYRKENKKLKENEVAISTVDAQKQEIELAEMYKDKMLDLLEQVSQKQDSGNANQEVMLRKIEKLDGRMDAVDSRVADVVSYLNGGFQEYLQRNHNTAKPAPRRGRKPKAAEA